MLDTCDKYHRTTLLIKGLLVCGIGIDSKKLKRFFDEETVVVTDTFECIDLGVKKGIRTYAFIRKKIKR